jgi:hypothetical protein
LIQPDSLWTSDLQNTGIKKCVVKLHGWGQWLTKHSPSRIWRLGEQGLRSEFALDKARWPGAPSSPLGFRLSVCRVRGTTWVNLGFEDTLLLGLALPLSPSPNVCKLPCLSCLSRVLRGASWLPTLLPWVVSYTAKFHLPWGHYQAPGSHFQPDPSSLGWFISTPHMGVIKLNVPTTLAGAPSMFRAPRAGPAAVHCVNTLQSASHLHGPLLAPTVTTGPFPSMPSPLGQPLSADNSHPNGGRWHLIVTLICISLMISDNEHHFIFMVIFMSTLDVYLSPLHIVNWVMFSCSTVICVLNKSWLLNSYPICGLQIFFLVCSLPFYFVGCFLCCVELSSLM